MEVQAFRRYSAAVFLAAGVSVCGKVWYDRANSALVKGEDVAECLGAAIERVTVAHSFGTNLPVAFGYSAFYGNTNGYNRVDNVPRVETFVTMFGALKRALVYDTSEAPVGWVDTDINFPDLEADGLGTYEYGWVPTDNGSGYTWEFATSNAVVVPTLYLLDSYLCSPAFFPTPNVDHYYYRQMQSAVGSVHTNAGGLAERFPGNELVGVIVGRPGSLQNTYHGSVELKNTEYSGLFDGYGSWWSKAELHPSNIFQVANHEGLTTNVPPEPFYNRAMTTSLLERAKTLAFGMRRSVCVRDILPMYPEQARSLLTTYTYTKTNGAYFSPSFSAALGAITENVEVSVKTNELWRVAAAGLGRCVFSDYTRSTVGTRTLICGGIEQESENISTNVLSDPQYTFGSFIRSTFAHVEEFTPDYPPLYAYTNGLVGRVRVYAVVNFAVSLGHEEPDEHDIIEGDESYYESTTTYTPWSSPGDINYAASFDLSQEFNMPVYSTPPGFSIGGTRTDSLPHPVVEKHGVTMLYDSEGPITTPPVFDIGVAKDIVSELGTGFWRYEEWLTIVDSNGTSGRDPDGSCEWEIIDITSNHEVTQTGIYTGDYSLYVDKLIIIVDWNWSHLNPNTPYVPENWIPAWVTNNVFSVFTP